MILVARKPIEVLPSPQRSRLTREPVDLSRAPRFPVPHTLAHVPHVIDDYMHMVRHYASRHKPVSRSVMVEQRILHRLRAIGPGKHTCTKPTIQRTIKRPYALAGMLSRWLVCDRVGKTEDDVLLN